MGKSSTISFLCISFETRSAISSECVIEVVSEADSAHGDKKWNLYPSRRGKNRIKGNRLSWLDVSSRS